MKHGLKILIIALFGFTLLTTCAAFGAIIQEVVVCSDFDTNGNPIPNDQIPVTDDAVFVWVNMTDIHAKDTLLFEWWPPSGELYYEETWTAADWLDNTPHYSMMSEIEIMGEPAENMPGEWAVNIYNNGTWWGHAVFYIIDGSSSSDSSTGSDSEVIRGYYIWVTDVRVVGDVALGQNTTIEVDLEYNFLGIPLALTVIDENSDVRSQISDTIQGNGKKTYTMSMKTLETDDTSFFAAIAYYFIDGRWTYMDPNGYMPFTLGQGGGSGSSDGIELPDGIDFSAIDMEQITSKLNDTIQKGLDILKDVEIPDELSDIEDTIKEKTGIPGYPVEALVLGAAVLVYASRRRL